MRADARRNPCRSGEVVKRVKAYSDGGVSRASTLEKQRVERTVEREEGSASAEGQERPPRSDCDNGGDAGGSAGPVAPAKVELIARRSPGEQKASPRNRAMSEVGLDHLPEAHRLEVLPLDRRIELDPPPGARDARTEIHVLEPLEICVEATRSDERLSANGAKPRPKRRYDAGRRLVHVVMKEIAERGDGARPVGHVVVRPEDRGKSWIAFERRTEPAKDIGMHFDVRVDEHQDLAACLLGPVVSRVRGRRHQRWADNDHFLGRGLCRTNGCEAALERRRIVRCRHDCRDTRHAPIVIRAQAESDQRHTNDEAIERLEAPFEQESARTITNGAP